MAQGTIAKNQDTESRNSKFESNAPSKPVEGQKWKRDETKDQGYKADRKLDPTHSNEEDFEKDNVEPQTKNGRLQ